MPKNAYFWKKAKKSPQRRGLCSRTLTDQRPLKMNEAWGSDSNPRFVTPAYSFVECVSRFKRILLL